MNRHYAYSMAVGLLVFWVPLIYGDEPTSATAEGCPPATETSPAEPGDRSDPPGWFKMFGYPSLEHGWKQTDLSWRASMRREQLPSVRAHR